MDVKSLVRGRAKTHAVIVRELVLRVQSRCPDEWPRVPRLERGPSRGTARQAESRPRAPCSARGGRRAPTAGGAHRSDRDPEAGRTVRSLLPASRNGGRRGPLDSRLSSRPRRSTRCRRTRLARRLPTSTASVARSTRRSEQPVSTSSRPWRWPATRTLGPTCSTCSWHSAGRFRRRSPLCRRLEFCPLFGPKPPP